MRVTRNISIRTKLASLVALNVLVLAGVSLYTVGQVRNVREEIREIAQEDIPLTKALTDLARDQQQLDARLERVLRLEGLGRATAAGTGGRAAVATARELLAGAERAEAADLRRGQEVARRALAHATTPASRAEFAMVVGALDRIGGAYAGFVGEVDAVLGLVAAGRPADAEAALPAVERHAADLERETAALAAEVERFTAESAAHAEVHERLAIRHVSLAGAGGILGGLLLGSFYASNISRRLRTAVGVANRLAAGERNFEVPVEGRDEARDLMRAMRSMAGEVSRSEQGLKHEQQRSERLLLNILPPSIAARLKDEHRSIADGFAEVSVLFADVVGFTELSRRMPPADLVRVLNGVFTAFDHLAERHGLEKIKTIGDCYMAVAGIPLPHADHAAAVAEMALAMLDALARFDTGRPGERLRVRIGINSGPVVAGVIGVRKFIYDLWGDTVNVASRMESHGVPGEVQVSEATYQLLRGTYAFEPRGTIEVKGRGGMDVYLLKGRLVAPAAGAWAGGTPSAG